MTKTRNGENRPSNAEKESCLNQNKKQNRENKQKSAYQSNKNENNSSPAIISIFLLLFPRFSRFYKHFYRAGGSTEHEKEKEKLKTVKTG